MLYTRPSTQAAPPSTSQAATPSTTLNAPPSTAPPTKMSLLCPCEGGRPCIGSASAPLPTSSPSSPALHLVPSLQGAPPPPFNVDVSVERAGRGQEVSLEVGGLIALDPDCNIGLSVLHPGDCPASVGCGHRPPQPAALPPGPGQLRPVAGGLPQAPVLRLGPPAGTLPRPAPGLQGGGLGQRQGGGQAYQGHQCQALPGTR